MAGARFRGTVKWFNQARNFGFVAADEGPDLFLDGRCVLGDEKPTAGDRIEYYAAPRPGRLSAAKAVAIILPAAFNSGNDRAERGFGNRAIRFGDRF
jgi:cold shock protein